MRAKVQWPGSNGVNLLHINKWPITLNNIVFLNLSLSVCVVLFSACCCVGWTVNTLTDFTMSSMCSLLEKHIFNQPTCFSPLLIYLYINVLYMVLLSVLSVPLLFPVLHFWVSSGSVQNKSPQKKKKKKHEFNIFFQRFQPHHSFHQWMYLAVIDLVQSSCDTAQL